MFIDTHCHVNMIIKSTFDEPLLDENYQFAQEIITEAALQHVTKIINVGTSLPESLNCVALAQKFLPFFAAVGIHPNDCTPHWRKDLIEIEKLVRAGDNKIVAIGECGIDKHYPEYDIDLQRAAFIAQIELALMHDLAIIVHTRDAGVETLACLQQFKGQKLRGVIHCFSEDLAFASAAIDLGFVLGIGGAITYPKNEQLRTLVKTVGLEHILLETDAPFLPPQAIRGKKNSPAQIATIAAYCANLLNVRLEDIAAITTTNAQRTFKLF